MSLPAWYTLNQLAWHRGFSVPFVAGLAAGYLFHLAGDWMTNSGVPLLWPSRRRFVAPIHLFTGDALEYLLAFGMYGWVMVRGTAIFG